MYSSWSGSAVSDSEIFLNIYYVFSDFWHLYLIAGGQCNFWKFLVAHKISNEFFVEFYEKTKISFDAQLSIFAKN